MVKSNTQLNNSKNYRQMSDELADILNWFEQDDIDVDEAVNKYESALKLINNMEKYLKQTENKIKKISAKEK